MGTQEHADCPRTRLREQILRALGMPSDLHVDTPEVTYGRTWTRDGIAGVELSWHDTEAWLLKPAGHIGTDLPAVLLLHGHDGVKFYGKEKVADGPDGPAPGILDLRQRAYDGRAVAASLVGAGFAVLVHDVFPWGSRRVDWDDFPERAKNAARMYNNPQYTDRDRYEAAAREHEHGLAKIAALTGTSLAGRILQEDLLALQILGTIPGIDPTRIATSGFSGGGARVAHLSAAAELKAAVITAMVSTFTDVADGHADDTTWLMITPGLPAVCDWPDVVASAAPMPLLVQFAQEDSHFGVAGMRDAEASLQQTYGESNSLVTQWFPGRHRFTAPMQDAAVLWLQATV